MAAGRRNEGGEAPLPPHRRHAEEGEKEDTPWNSWLKVGGVNSPEPPPFSVSFRLHLRHGHPRRERVPVAPED